MGYFLLFYNIATKKADRVYCSLSNLKEDAASLFQKLSKKDALHEIPMIRDGAMQSFQLCAVLA